MINKTLTCRRCDKTETFSGESVDAIIFSIWRADWSNDPYTSVCPECQETERLDNLQEAK